VERRCGAVGVTMDKRRTLALALIATQFLLLGALAFSFLLLPPDQVLWAQALGLAAALSGTIIAALAILTHLRVNRALVNVSPEPNPQRQLVQTGLYRCIRHPIYLGVMLTAGGAAVAHGHPVGLMLALALIVFFAGKARFEEQWLAHVYPAYVDYRRRTGRFLPAIGRCSRTEEATP